MNPRLSLPIASLALVLAACSSGGGGATPAATAAASRLPRLRPAPPSARRASRRRWAPTRPGP